MKKFFKNNVNLLIALALFVVIMLCKPANGLTQTGIYVLSVLLPVMYLWITVDTVWPSLLLQAGFIIIGIFAPNTLYASTLGSWMIMLVLLCMMLNGILVKTGVVEYIAKWFITRKLVKGKPYMFLGMYLLAYLLLNMFMESLSLLIIFLALSEGICKSLKFEKGEKFYTCIFIGVMWTAIVGSVTTPISHTIPLLLVSLAEGIGCKLTFAKWMSIGIPFGFLIYAVEMLIFKYVVKPDVEKFTNYEFDKERANLGKLSKEGVIAAVAYIIVILAWLLPEIVPSAVPWLVSATAKWGSTLPPLIAFVILCILKVDGKPIGNFADAGKSLNIGVLIFMSTILVVGGAITSEATGVSVFLTNVLIPITQNMPVMLLIVFIIIAAGILTNFISNTVTITLFYTLATSLLNGRTDNMVGVLIMMGIISCCAVLTPSGNVSNALFYGPKHVDVKEAIKYNLLLVLGCFVCIFLLWPIAQAL